MADIHVRKLDEWVVEVHQRLAKNLQDSLENHVRKIFTEAAIDAQNKFADSAEKRVLALKEKYGELLPSEKVVSEERWERG